MIKENIKKYLLGMILLVAVLFVTGVSYALWSMTLTQETSNVITTGCFNVEYSDENPINLQSAYPITDEEGKNLVPYTFTITNTCNTLVKYQVNLEVLNTSTLLNHSYLKVQFDNDTPKLLNSYPTMPKILENATTAYELKTGVLSKRGSKTFTLGLWLNENTPSVEEAMNKTFESKIVIQTVGEINRYTEDALNGADPVIKENLIPITIANDGTVTKADIKREWYNYENKRWANAVILKDESIVYSDGANISEDNIESYFVWIPRYRYKIFNDTLYNGLTEIDTSKVQSIEIEFESIDVIPSKGTKNNEWLTHPAFTSFDSNGMWVGKFETSRSSGQGDWEINPRAVQIKPNVVSWRSIQIGAAFYTAYDYERNLDSHMMKNTEWGATAFLTHSKYGANSEIRANNNSNYLTGYATVTNDAQYGTTSNITLPYNTEIGFLASTTGNITGIYDMSGGVYEYVMGVVTDANGVPFSGKNSANHSGFMGPYGEGGSLTNGYSWPNDKYYDKYQYGTSIYDYTRRILGDATGEMGPFKSDNSIQISSWYSSGAWAAHNILPFYSRGGGFDPMVEAGLFEFAASIGIAHHGDSFRVVLTP